VLRFATRGISGVGQPNSNCRSQGGDNSQNSEPGNAHADPPTSPPLGYKARFNKPPSSNADVLVGHQPPSGVKSKAPQQHRRVLAVSPLCSCLLDGLVMSEGFYICLDSPD
jgi:hypothetical protein